MGESGGYKIKYRDPIECGVAGEMIVIQYGDASTGRSERVVTIEQMFSAMGNLFLEGFCHSKGEMRTFRFDRIHSINELPQGGYFTSCTDWMASYGVAIEIYQQGQQFKYRLSRA